jgi:hypothetical protein
MTPTMSVSRIRAHGVRPCLEGANSSRNVSYVFIRTLFSEVLREGTNTLPQALHELKHAHIAREAKY